MIILPQKWVFQYAPLPRGWLSYHAPGLLKKVPDIEKRIDEVAKNVGVSAKLFPPRMELEQSAISYKWDGSTKDYGGGVSGEIFKLMYLCGVDKTDGGPRKNGWFGPKPQLLGCALRFKYWYRGINPRNETWKNWLGFVEDAAYRPGVPVKRQCMTIIPGNQISADCLRYTTGMEAQHNLAAIARKFFPEDFAE